MIPRDYVTAWRASAPWVEDAQVEQDLVISRALVEMFERNLDGKLRDREFGSDMSGLLATGGKWHAIPAAGMVTETLLSLLPGDEWRGPKLSAEPSVSRRRTPKPS